MENCPQTKENSVETHVTKIFQKKVIYIILQIGFSFFSPQNEFFMRFRIFRFYSLRSLGCQNEIFHKENSGSSHCLLFSPFISCVLIFKENFTFAFCQPAAK
jgi:hypothetical protein